MYDSRHVLPGNEVQLDDELLHVPCLLLAPQDRRETGRRPPSDLQDRPYQDRVGKVAPA